MSVRESLRVTGRELPILNPATEEPVATVYVADERRVNRAVDCATRAFSTWRNFPLRQRRAFLSELANTVRDNASHLARLLTLEQGKPLQEAEAEVAGAEAFLRYCAGAGGIDAESLFAFDNGTHARLYTPLGVVAGIIPWNYPLMIVAMKVGSALLAGNVIIIKPAPTTPVTTLALARLWVKLVPMGVIQVVVDDGQVGPQLLAHPGIRKVAFTGSTRTGRAVMAAAANDLKRVTLELGGNDPAIVLHDADPGAAAAGIFRVAFINAGQLCGAVKRVYVHESLYAPFCEVLSKLVQGVVVGNGLEPGVTMGPLQNRMQYDRASDLLEDASRQGRIISQAQSPQGKGYFIPPTLFGDLSNEHPLVAEEQFSPLLPVQRFSDDSDAITQANSTPYGLTASVWSKDAKHAEAVARQIDAGLLCINKHNEVSFDWSIPLAKHSGVGCVLGDESIKEYLQAHLLVR